MCNFRYSYKEPVNNIGNSPIICILLSKRRRVCNPRASGGAGRFVGLWRNKIIYYVCVRVFIGWFKTRFAKFNIDTLYSCTHRGSYILLLLFILSNKILCPRHRGLDIIMTATRSIENRRVKLQTVERLWVYIDDRRRQPFFFFNFVYPRYTPATSMVVVEQFPSQFSRLRVSI